MSRRARPPSPGSGAKIRDAGDSERRRPRFLRPATPRARPAVFLSRFYGSANANNAESLAMAMYCLPSTA
jgi:hypothetical protein